MTAVVAEVAASEDLAEAAPEAVEQAETFDRIGM